MTKPALVLLLATALLPAVSINATTREHVEPSRVTAPLSQEVFYQIFVRSMRDSDGDQQGDLKGLRQSLDYLQRLGVTSILLTPLYPSEFYHNYFADDFDGIDAEYGTLSDFRDLLKDIHARDMKLYLDEEFQYVAYGHEWYKEALGNPTSRHSDKLIWHGPNNTQPESGPFGLTLAPRFPKGVTGITTVNMKSAAVRAWAGDYLLAWVDPNGDGDFADGVDGFRLDHMMDDLDDKKLLTNLFEDFWAPVLARVRAANPKIVFIAEQSDWGDGRDYLTRGGVDAVFAFPIANAIRSFDKDRIVAAISEVERATPPGKHQLIFVENHDMARIASMPHMTEAKLRTAASLGMLLQGTPLIYYGQELGMRGIQYDIASDAKDIGLREAFRWSADIEGAGQANWYRGPEIYWTQRAARSNDGISVAEQDGDRSSLLAQYRRLLKLRRDHPALVHGTQRIIDSAPGVLVVERVHDGRRIRIVANLTPAPVDPSLPKGVRPLLGARVGKTLAPFETLVVALK